MVGGETLVAGEEAIVVRGKTLVAGEEVAVAGNETLVAGEDTLMAGDKILWHERMVRLYFDFDGSQDISLYCIVFYRIAYRYWQ